MQRYVGSDLRRLDVEPVEVLSTLESLGLTAANNNGAGQVVAAGTLDQLSALSDAPPARARVIPLPLVLKIFWRIIIFDHRD